MNPNNDQEPTLGEVLEAVNNGFTTVENQFKKIENQFKKIETDITAIKANMVTKDYLDVKVADLKGDIVVIIRKEDQKLAALIEVLTKKAVITAADAKQILSLQPFPQLFV